MYFHLYQSTLMNNVHMKILSPVILHFITPEIIYSTMIKVHSMHKINIVLGVLMYTPSYDIIVETRFCYLGISNNACIIT